LSNFAPKEEKVLLFERGGLETQRERERDTGCYIMRGQEGKELKSWKLGIKRIEYRNQPIKSNSSKLEFFF
jgi:hypothetical protein